MNLQRAQLPGGRLDVRNIYELFTKFISITVTGGHILRLFKRIAKLASFPVIFADFFARSTGFDYGITLMTKLRVANRIRQARKSVPVASGYSEHLVMVTRILKVPRSVEGSLIECGTWKGGSAVTLSLVAELCGRKLHIFDSFAGLPAPEAADLAYSSVGETVAAPYAQGSYCGQLEEVRANITKYGKINRCIFHKGYFCDTLPEFHEPSVFVFLDVDLVESLRDCMRYLWPTLQANCWLFTHEARDYNIAAAFYDKPWWHTALGVLPPGLIGAGGGLGLEPSPGGYVSDIGCTVKIV